VSIAVLAPPTAASRSFRLRYGIGLRVFTDQKLLEQISDAIFHNVMEPEEIARLENVPTAVLVGLLEQRCAGVSALREFAAEHKELSVMSWRTTRKHPTKLHICDGRGVTLCGIRKGRVAVAVNDGPCLTCADHARLELTAA
jgi:hypothetical protein